MMYYVRNNPISFQGHLSSFHHLFKLSIYDGYYCIFYTGFKSKILWQYSIPSLCIKKNKNSILKVDNVVSLIKTDCLCYIFPQSFTRENGNSCTSG